MKKFLCLLVFLPSAAFAADTLGAQGVIDNDVAPAAQTLGALNAACTVTMAGKQGASVYIPTSSTLAGTLTPEVTIDGTNWVATEFIDAITQISGATQVTVSGTSYAKQILLVGGARQARARVSAYTSGSAQCSAVATLIGSPNLIVQGPQALGAALNTANNKPVLIGAQDASGEISPPMLDVFDNMKISGSTAQNGGQQGGPVAVGAIAWGATNTPTTAASGNVQNMATNLDGVQFVTAGGPNRFSCSQNALAATLTTCQAAPGAGLFLYVDEMYVQSATTTAGTYGVSCGTGAACVTTNVALFPVSGTANRWTAPASTSPLQVINFNPPLKCPTAAQEICVIGATNTVSIQIEGHTGH